jgi:FKBP-type peptidyl-prolyl cis-trans isomerase 2
MLGPSKKGKAMSGILEPGMLVRHPDQADWGLGQVQSVIEPRVTVNFEHAGKVVIDMRRIILIPEFGPLFPPPHL